MAEPLGTPMSGAILVTGAAGTIGSALLRNLAVRSQVTLIGAIRPRVSEHTVLAESEIHPTRIRFVEMDQTDWSSISAAACVVESWTDRLDMLINCAGVNVSPGYPRPATKGPLGEFDADALTAMMRINAVGPLMVTQAFAGLLDRAEYPWIVNVTTERASLAGATDPGSVGYAMSKAALNMASRKIAAEKASAGWRVVSVHPGWVRSPVGGSDAPLHGDDAAARILASLEQMPAEAANTGAFVDLDGGSLPW